MRIMNDEQAVTVTLETILLFTITVMMLGMVMLAFNSINDRASETVMKEQYASIGNDVASKIVDMDVEIKASLLKDSVVEIQKELNLPPLIANKPYEIEITAGKIIVSSASSPFVSVVVPLDPDVNVADGSKVHSMVADHTLIYEHNGQIMFENGGVDAMPDNTWPTISILTPNNGAKVSDIATITVLALDNVGISRVEYYIDGYYQTTVSNVPYSWKWNTYSTSDGTYTIAAMVYDRAGHYNSDTRSYTVDNGVDSMPPTGEIVSPLNGTVTDYNPVLIEAIVRDNIAIDFSSIEIWLFETGNGTWTDITPFATITNTTLTEYNIQYLPPTPLYSETYEVYVNASELFYGSGDPKNKNVSLWWNFTIVPITDTTNPTITITSPVSSGDLVTGNPFRVEYTATDNTAGDDSGIDYLVINVTLNSSFVYTKRVNISTYPNVIKTVTSAKTFTQTYVEYGIYTYNVTVYDRAGHSAIAETGPFTVPSGMASELEGDFIDTNIIGSKVDFIIRSKGPAITINKMDIDYPSGEKLKYINFDGVTKWSSSGTVPIISAAFAPTQTVTTADRMVTFELKTPPAATKWPDGELIQVTVYFTDGTSTDIVITAKG
ncbi:MAG: Ig-like domain-containing protein [ANME-2 cluster archaeon]|nr:Ig-like domain-containing protein [ANME-2 cluster archaeon]